MIIKLTRALLIVTILWPTLIVSPVGAREGDTLEPITIDAPTLETYPENLLHEDDFRLINGRVQEARNSGVPLAVRIVDLTLEDTEIPFAVRQYARDDFSQPQSEERQQAIVESWMRSESIETSEGANDGFLLLVLVPEDRSQTQAIWWVGPNALPLNGLTMDNILATQEVMNAHFDAGNMPTGVYQGISEFSYNIQFGVPERIERSRLENALLFATIPMAISTAISAVAIVGYAVVGSRRNNNTAKVTETLTPWEAAALSLGRARAEIPSAMLLDALHRGEIMPVSGGSFSIGKAPSNQAVEVLRDYADDDGTVSPTVMYEIEAILEPVRSGIETALAGAGAMSNRISTDRYQMLILMGLTGFLAALTTVPSVMSMSEIGVLSIAIALVGLAIGWWWLAYRRHTSPAGEVALKEWLESATSEERLHYNLAVHQYLLTEQRGGPDVTAQNQVVRRLRGYGSA